MSKVPFESVHGYKIIEAISFDNDRGIALGMNPKAAFPLATWQFDVNAGKREMYWGHYYLAKDGDVAKLDYSDRIKTYLQNNPEVREKYNYLAAAEMSVEGNYNQIDGIINNTPASDTKPSILDQLRDFQHKSVSPEPQEKPSKQPGIEL